MKYVTTESVATQVIEQTNGRVFGATTRLRRDGSVRTFNAKLADRTPEQREKDRCHRQVTVIDVNKTRTKRAETGDPEAVAYRTIALEHLDSLRADGKTYNF